eukprot:6510276-Prymnesium_polylepis.1
MVAAPTAGDRRATRRGAIATLIRHEAQLSGYSQLIERTRAIGRVRVLMDAYDHILFHDGPMASVHEDHIRSQVGGNLSSQLRFIDVAQRFHSRDQIIRRQTANSQKYGCPAAVPFRPGYSAMCAFWFIDIPEVLGESYSYLLRIDADCIRPVARCRAAHRPNEPAGSTVPDRARDCAVWAG